MSIRVACLKVFRERSWRHGPFRIRGGDGWRRRRLGCGRGAAVRDAGETGVKDLARVVVGVLVEEILCEK